MSFYQNLEQLSSHAQSRSFQQLISIKSRAEQILGKSSVKQWKAAAPLIQELVSVFRASYFEFNKKNYIQTLTDKLFIEGGWELDFLPNSLNPTTTEIKHLLENWPSGAPKLPNFPEEYQFSDLDFLGDIISSGFLYGEIDGFLSAKKYEIYAVLALIKLDKAAGFLIAEKGELSAVQLSTPWDSNNIISAWDLVIEAMEIFCYAERLFLDEQFGDVRTTAVKRLETDIRAEIRKENAKQGALAKLAADPKQKDKTQVFECWFAWKSNPLDHFGRPKYKNNEAFSKDMLKFENLVSTQVIARWCRAWGKEYPTLCAK